MRKRLWWIVAVAGLGAAVYACSGLLHPPRPAPATPQPGSWGSAELTVAYLGHASVLIDFAGTRILTDPAFFDRIGPSVGGVTIGPKRLVRSALAPQELPSLAAIVVTHAHMDSLDRPSLARVAHTPLLVVPTSTRDLVDDLGFARVVEIGWGGRIEAGDVTIEAVPVNHWGKRWPGGRWRGYNGYLFRRGDVEVLFASDTAYTESIGVLGKDHRLSAAILGNGAYDPWIMNHADPEQVWRMFKESGACYLLPVHWDTFRLGKEPVGEAMTRLLAAAGTATDRVAFRQIGETWSLPAGGCTR